MLVLWRGSAISTVALTSEARPSDMNERGQVVGLLGTSQLVPFLWEEGQTTILAPEAWTSPEPRVNDSGQVVYTSGSPVGPSVWQNGRSTPLNRRLTGSEWDLVSADDINNAGQIIGVARTRTGNRMGVVVLTPVR